MITIGITGSIGAGKGTIVDYLQTKGFKHFGARSVLVDELNRRNLPTVRENMHAIANEFRKKSPSYIMEVLLAERNKTKENAVIEAQRSLGEIEYLRKNIKKFYLFAVDANETLRYERIVARKSSTDNITFEKFLEDNKREDNNTEIWSTSPTACIQVADFIFKNDGVVEELYAQIEEVLKVILPK